MRLLAVDRPGFGASDPKPELSFTDYPNDIRAFADDRALYRFGVVGVSMGAGFALACAALLPERVSSVLILSGMGPLKPNEQPRVTSPGDATYWWMARRAPWLLKPMCAVAARATRSGASRDPAKFNRRLRKSLSPQDQVTLERMLARAGVREALVRDIQESYRQGGGAMASDVILYSRPWGFSLHDIPARVDLWHGLQDPRVPLELARRVEAELPSCRSHFVDGGHMVACDHIEEIVPLMRGRWAAGEVEG